MLDTEVIEKFKEFQKKTGKYQDLVIEDIQFEKVSLSNSEYFELNPKKSEIDEELIKDNILVSFVPLPNIDKEFGVMDTSIKRNIQDVKKGYTYFKEGDVIFTKVTPSMENGNFAIANSLFNGIGFGSSEYYIFRCKKVYNKFLWFLFRADFFKKRAKKVMKGAGGLKRVPLEFFDTEYIPIPKDLNEKYTSLEVQKIIIEFLEEWRIKYTDIYRKTVIYQKPIMEKIKNALVPATFIYERTLQHSFNNFLKNKRINIKLEDIKFKEIEFFIEKIDDLKSSKKLEKNQNLILKKASNNGLPVYTGALKLLCKIEKEDYPNKVFSPNPDNPDISFANNGDGSAGRNFFIHYDEYFVNQERTVVTFNKDKKFYSLYVLNQINTMRDKFNMNRTNRPTPKDLPKFGIKIKIPFHNKYETILIQRLLVEFWTNIIENIETNIENIDKIDNLTDKIDEAFLYRTFNKIDWSNK